MVAAVVAGCWSDDDQIDGFTPDQWAALKQDLSVPQVDPCNLPNQPTSVHLRCAQLAAFGQLLFTDPALSTRNASTTMPSPGTISCATCHDTAAWFIDSRRENNVSLGVSKWTKRNAMATVDLALKYQLETTAAFTWNGKFKTPGSVLELAIAGPFGNTKNDVATIARSRYIAELTGVCGFGSSASDDLVIGCLETALDAYMFQITSLNSPFDQWLSGNDAAMSTAAKHGFELFVGRGTCIECHNGPAFSDFSYHDTGVPQTGPNVPETDLGRSDVTHLIDDDGKFMTPSLRNVARTAPYMHDGAFASLDDVVDFYRRGGGDSNYSGVKDPRIVPLDLTDDDAHDLVAFLQSLDGATTGSNAMGGTGSAGGPACQMPDIPCHDMCVNPLSDSANCGGCGAACAPTDACVMGICMPPPLCPPGWLQCGGNCVDAMTDPMNCGACGHVCTTYCMNGVCG